MPLGIGYSKRQDRRANVGMGRTQLAGSPYSYRAGSNQPMIPPHDLPKGETSMARFEDFRLPANAAERYGTHTSSVAPARLGDTGGNNIMQGFRHAIGPVARTLDFPRRALQHGVIDPLITALMNTNPQNMRWGHWENGNPVSGLAPSVEQGSTNNKPSPLLGHPIQSQAPQLPSLPGQQPTNPWHNQIFGHMQGSPPAGPVPPERYTIDPNRSMATPDSLRIGRDERQSLDRSEFLQSLIDNPTRTNPMDVQRPWYPGSQLQTSRGGDTAHNQLMSGNRTSLGMIPQQGLPPDLQARVDHQRMMDRSSMPQGLTASARGIMSREAPQPQAPPPAGLSPEVQQFRDQFLADNEGLGWGKRRAMVSEGQFGGPRFTGQERSTAEREASLQGRLNRQRGLTFGGEQMGPSREDARQARIAERLGSVNEGRQGYINSRRGERGLPPINFDAYQQEQERQQQQAGQPQQFGQPSAPPTGQFGIPQPGQFSQGSASRHSADRAGDQLKTPEGIKGFVEMVSRAKKVGQGPESVIKQFIDSGWAEDEFVGYIHELQAKPFDKMTDDEAAMLNILQDHYGQMLLRRSAPPPISQFGTAGG